VDFRSFRLLAVLALAFLVSTGTASAVPFVGTPSPALSPVFGTLIDFDDMATGTPVGLNDYLGLGVTIAQVAVGIPTQIARYAGSQSLPNYIGTGFAGERPDPTDANLGWDGIIRFSFLAPVRQVGIGIADSQGGPETIRIYDSGNNLLETFVVPSGGNVYAGFTRGSFDIAYFEVTGDYFAADDLQFDAASVPEPTTLALRGGGLLGLARRRRAKR